MSTLIQGSAGSFLVYLVDDTTGLPATGLVDTAITADLKKASGAFAAFAVTATNFSEHSAGFYEIDLVEADTNVLGNLYLRVQGATVKTFLAQGYVVATVADVPSTVVAPPFVAIFGYAYRPDATPMADISVSARILSSPAVLFTGTDGMVIGQELVTTTTDSDGFFSMNLIPGTSVDFFISAARYRRTFRVPAATTSVFEIP